MELSTFPPEDSLPDHHTIDGQLLWPEEEEQPPDREGAALMPTATCPLPARWSRDLGDCRDKEGTDQLATAVADGDRDELRQEVRCLSTQMDDLRALVSLALGLGPEEMGGRATPEPQTNPTGGSPPPPPRSRSTPMPTLTPEGVRQAMPPHEMEPRPGGGVLPQAAGRPQLNRLIAQYSAAAATCLPGAPTTRSPQRGPGVTAWPRSEQCPPGADRRLRATFDGSPDRLDYFVIQATQFMADWGWSFPTEASKVQYVSSRLEGEAATWYGHMYNAAAPELANYKLFMQALRGRFDDPFQEEEAKAELQRLRQGSSSVKEYSMHFRLLASRVTDWPEATKAHLFRNGLSRRVLEWSLLQGDPKTVADWMRLAGQAEAKLNILALTPQDTALEGVNKETKGGWSEEGKVQRRKETDCCLREGLCLHCGAKGHVLVNCPKYPGKGKGRTPTPGGKGDTPKPSRTPKANLGVQHGEAAEHWMEEAETPPEDGGEESWGPWYPNEESRRITEPSGRMAMAGTNSKESINKGIAGMKASLGQSRLQDVLANAEKELKLLKDTKLDIALTGVSGAGKLSLVNAFRNVSDFDEGAAKTGVTKTTMDPAKYPHPKFPELTIWDLPGTGNPLLQKMLANYLNDLKRSLLIMAMPAFSREHLQKKKAAMEALIWKKALISCTIGVIPIPGVSLMFNIGFLVHTMKVFCKAFGLDNESLRNLANQVGKPVDVLKSAVKKTPMAHQITPEFVQSLTTKYLLCGTAMVLEELSDFIPVLGCIVGGVNSFATTYFMLTSFLDDAMEDAESILAKVAE